MVHSSLYSVAQTDSDTVEQTFSETELHSCRELVLDNYTIRTGALRLDCRSDVSDLTQHMENNLLRSLACFIVQPNDKVDTAKLSVSVKLPALVFIDSKTLLFLYSAALFLIDRSAGSPIKGVCP